MLNKNESRGSKSWLFGQRVVCEKGQATAEMRRSTDAANHMLMFKPSTLAVDSRFVHTMQPVWVSLDICVKGREGLTLTFGGYSDKFYCLRQCTSKRG